MWKDFKMSINMMIENMFENNFTYITLYIHCYIKVYTNAICLLFTFLHFIVQPLHIKKVTSVTIKKVG